MTGSLILIVSCPCRIVITIGYYALILNTSNLHGNPYLNCFFSAATEVPAYIIALLLLQRCSRRFCQSSSLFLGGTMILCVRLIPIGNQHSLAPEGSLCLKDFNRPSGFPELTTNLYNSSQSFPSYPVMETK